MYGYFDIQALVGITKHPGGLTFTRRLVERCNVTASMRLLYVGVGNGNAAARIAWMTGCEVIGIDRSTEMVQVARAAEGGRIGLLAADAERLPFSEGTFDVVIAESVTAFTCISRSLPEYCRVLKPGGRIGLNETTWLEPPTPDLVEYFQQLDRLSPRLESEWVRAIADAGFNEIRSETGPLRPFEQMTGELRMIDRRYFGIMRRFLSRLVRDPEFRQSLRSLAGSSMAVPKGLTRTFGYGLYVARR